MTEYELLVVICYGLGRRLAELKGDFRREVIARRWVIMEEERLLYRCG